MISAAAQARLRYMDAPRAIVIPASIRNADLRALLEFLLPWRLEAMRMTHEDLRDAAMMLRLTAMMLEELAGPK